MRELQDWREYIDATLRDFEAADALFRLPVYAKADKLRNITRRIRGLSVLDDTMTIADIVPFPACQAPVTLLSGPFSL